MQYLKSVWYMMAWAQEIEAGRILARTIADQPLVLFRGADGTASVMDDLCPHRFAPLSLGAIRDGRIVCGYHGLEFDTSGRCVVNPHGPVLRAARVKTYVVREANGILWVWLGDAEAAEAAPLPDFGFLDHASDTAKRAGYMFTRAGAQLCVDNILDLSHADVLHPGSLGGGATTRTRSTASEDGDSITLSWDMRDETPLPFLGALYPGHDTLDMWIDVTWSAPGVMYLEAGGGPVGGARADAAITYNLHIMMPETARTTHYFYCNVRNYRTDDADYHEALSAALRTAFETEDKPMLEAQQARIGERDFETMRPLLLPSDHGTVRVRRKIQAMLATEQAAAAPRA